MNGNTKPSSSENVSDRRNRESLRQRDVSRQNSSSHEVTAEQRVQTLEVRPFASVIESLSKRRFCQHGRQPEVNRVVIDGE